MHDDRGVQVHWRQAEEGEVHWYDTVEGAPDADEPSDGSSEEYEIEDDDGTDDEDQGDGRRTHPVRRAVRPRELRPKPEKRGPSPQCMAVATLPRVAA